MLEINLPIGVGGGILNPAVVNAANTAGRNQAQNWLNHMMGGGGWIPLNQRRNYRQWRNQMAKLGPMGIIQWAQNQGIPPQNLAPFFNFLNQGQAAQAQMFGHAQNPKVAMWNAFGQNPQLFNQWRAANTPQWGGPVGQWMWDNFKNALPNMINQYNQSTSQAIINNRNQRNFLRELALRKQQQNDLNAFRNRMLDMVAGNFGTGANAMIEMSKNIGKGLSGINWFNTAGGQGVRHIDGSPVLSQSVPDTDVERYGNRGRMKGGDIAQQTGVSGKSVKELSDALASGRRSGASRYLSVTDPKWRDAKANLGTARAGTVAKDTQGQLKTSTAGKANQTKNQIADIGVQGTVDRANKLAGYSRAGAMFDMLTNQMGNMFGMI